ncbi:class I adenylate-forming enzyme family protein [Litoreibacter roseus]|uniref:AMP-binding protein n=1 Tax=Litoreibacter roseus TaxID=2601869 RepID=A0A6N6JGV2_9RHOB|nr:class I adenylate-forming enzyme family protein [Litoreibacter roseus]GFE65583.1 AMP-binding protein [Litoreibacter roseus]
MTQTICDLLKNAATRSPDSRAIEDTNGPKWTYADFSKAVESAKAVLDTHGVAAGDRVLIITENCAAAVAFVFACSQQGAWAVPVNARQTSHEIDRVLNHATPRLVVCASLTSPETQAHAQRLGATPVDGAFGQVSVATPCPSSPAVEDGVAVLLYTTGTTGQPKGVMLTHDNLIFAGQASAHIRQIAPSDIVYGALPMTHVFGLASMIMASVTATATIRLEARFSAQKLFDALRTGVTVLPAVPQMHALLMQYTRENGHEHLKDSALRYVSSGAAPLDPVWKRKAEDFYGIALQNGYGMTESTAGIASTSNTIGDPDISVGHPLAGVEVSIDQTVPGGGDGIGEVLTRGPHVMRGYYLNPDETTKTLDTDGWLHTGDLGRIDDSGCLHILGRSKELIIHGGFNVYPPEVEAALNDHPNVVQSAVIGRPTSSNDEEILAFVQEDNSGDLTVDDLRDFIRPRLTGYKLPARIILTKALPAAPTGKILKHKLLDTFTAELGDA